MAGMDWWAALLVAGVPAVITSASLIIQQRFNTSTAERADESRRLDAEAERQHQERLLEVSNNHAREQANQDHRRHARDAWKADRRTAHTRLLTRLEEIEDATGSLVAGIGVDFALGDKLNERDFTLPDLPRELVTEVALVCSDASAKAAQRASNAVTLVAVAVQVLEVLHGTRPKSENEADVARIREHLKALQTTVNAYRQVAKQDIDTVE